MRTVAKRIRTSLISSGMNEWVGIRAAGSEYRYERKQFTHMQDNAASALPSHSLSPT